MPEFTIVFGIHSNFFFTLPDWLKLCRSNNFYLSQGKMCISQKWEHIRGFACPTTADRHQAHNFSSPVLQIIDSKISSKLFWTSLCDIQSNRRSLWGLYCMFFLTDGSIYWLIFQFLIFLASETAGKSGWNLIVSSVIVVFDPLLIIAPWFRSSVSSLNLLFNGWLDVFLSFHAIWKKIANWLHLSSTVDSI